MTDKTQKVFAILDHAVNLVGASPDSWKSYLAFSSTIYKYNFSDSLLIYVQRGDAEACASLELWNKLGRRIAAGKKDFRECIDLDKLKKSG